MGALSDIQILDFSRILAGPFATMMLADLGATVIKVEAPGGDDTRTWGPPFDDAGEATYFQSVNRNKHNLVLDLTQESDRARARELAGESDVIVENFRPGVMEKFGLSYADLRTDHPSLVYCSITGFGSGAGARMPGYDLLIQAVGGLMSLTGAPDGEPQKVGVALVDILAGLFSTVGILAALSHRDRTGEGQKVEVSLLASLLAALANQGAAYTSGGVVPVRMGNRHPSIAPYELLQCADREIVIAVGNNRQFSAFCEVLGAPELSQNPQFMTNEARVEHRTILRDELEKRLGTRVADDWIAPLTQAGVPAGKVNDLAGAFALAASLGMDPIVELPRADGGVVPLTRNPIGLSLTPAEYVSAPPSLASDAKTTLIPPEPPTST